MKISGLYVGSRRRNLWFTAFAFTAVCLFGAKHSYSQNVGSGAVTITSIGCGMAGAPGSAGGACFLYVNANVGPAGCNTNSIRWDPVQSPNGKEALSQLTAAYLAGKKVVFVLYDTCWAQWPSFPTIFYYEIVG